MTVRRRGLVPKRYAVPLRRLWVEVQLDVGDARRAVARRLHELAWWIDVPAESVWLAADPVDRWADPIVVMRVSGRGDG